MTGIINLEAPSPAAMGRLPEPHEVEDDDDDDDSTDSLSDVSDSSDYDYDTDDSDDDDDEAGGSLDASSLAADLEAMYQQQRGGSAKSTGALNVGGALNRGGAFLPPPTNFVEKASGSNKSMPNMQLDCDLSKVELTEEDNRSMRGLMERMNSTKTLTYFQEAAPEDEPAPIPLELDMGKVAGGRHRRTSVHEEPTATLDKQSPATHIAEIMEGLSGAVTDLSEEFWKTFFLKVTDKRKSAYSTEVVKAMRAQDLDKLRALHREGQSMEACNAQGESLLHLACRRRNHQLVKFLVEECKVSVRVQDDWGKTPLHELCWNSRPGKQYREQFNSVKLLVREAPELLLAKDKRGFSAFQYVPKDCWKDWRRFLDRYKKMIRCKVQLIGFVNSRNKLRETLEKAESAMSLLSGNKLK